MTMPQKICIIYGFCEGPQLAKRMLQTLRDAGFTIVHDPHQADIVLAHSGGCFLVPEDLPARQIVMIGLTHWPGHSIIGALIKKNWRDFRFHRSEQKVATWIHKFSWNLIYFWNMPTNFRMLVGRRQGHFWHVRNLVLIRNREDTFCTPHVTDLPFVHDPQYIELPDQHDDLWLHPERYVAIIKHNATRVLAAPDK